MGVFPTKYNVPALPRATCQLGRSARDGCFAAAASIFRDVAPHWTCWELWSLPGFAVGCPPPETCRSTPAAERHWGSGAATAWVGGSRSGGLGEPVPRDEASVGQNRPPWGQASRDSGVERGASLEAAHWEMTNGFGQVRGSPVGAGLRPRGTSWAGIPPRPPASPVERAALRAGI